MQTQVKYISERVPLTANGESANRYGRSKRRRGGHQATADR